jgi:lysophospholipase L1-like esterase
MPSAAFESTISTWEAQDASYPPPSGQTVAIGSSSIALWSTMASDLLPTVIIRRGLSGAVTDDLIYYRNRIVDPYLPTEVIIYIGENDIAAGATASATKAKIQTLCEAILTEFSSCQIFIMSIKPSPLRWAHWTTMSACNALLETYAGTDARLTYVDVSTALLSGGVPYDPYYQSDDLHLSAAGYAVWAGIMRTALAATPVPVGRSWAAVALSEMRKLNFSGAYMDSYAPNDDTIWGRRSTSSQYRRASLVMGRYASSLAFTTTNPDYTETSYITDTRVTQTTWNRLILWNHIWLSGTYKDQHVSGFINNTRVMFWDLQVWTKSKSTGQWTRHSFTDSTGGEWWSPDFRLYLGAYTSTPANYRTEPDTSYKSVKTVYAPTGQTTTTAADYGVDYWLGHGWAGLGAIDGNDIADVVASMKCSLVIDDLSLSDDREFSRYLVSVGADYYPDNNHYFYPGVGTSRQRFLRAKWPNWEYRVMHTMTQAQFEAPGGYPSAFTGLSEGSGTVTPLDDDDTTPPPVAPTRANWFNPVHDAGPPIVYAWEPAGVANVAENKIRRRRGSKMWS